MSPNGTTSTKTTRTLRLGIDTGGTFTDLTLFCARTGRRWELKVPSTPADPSEAIIKGIEEIAALARIKPTQIDYFGHGTTVATNTLIQLKGAKCSLVTTAGFQDLLEIGRQRRPELYDFQADKPPVLIPRSLRNEISERLLSDGSVLRTLNPEEVGALVKKLETEDIESVAICFLYSYLDGRHESLVKEAIRKAHPNLYIYISSEVLPEFREFERLSTTVLCAYLGPVVGRYSERLARRARDIGIPGDVYVTQSNGGIMSCSAVREKPIETALSGPASGVMAAAWMGSKAKIPNLITLDMGGTSADVCLIAGGTPSVTTERNVGGYPVKIPMLDVDTIGAGGGSIAWVDEGGALKVGPMSAGAEPGPACYGKGAIEPTVTDANVVLGRIDSVGLLAGQLKIHPDLARKAIEERVCKKFGLNVVQAAQGILTIVNDNMVRAVRAVSVERGYDPREFTLLAFGGAGPLHAVDVARELGMRNVLIPSSPGTFSSLGLLISDFRSDFVRTRILPAQPESLRAIKEILRELTDRAMRWLTGEKIPRQKMQLRASVDARYRKQNYEHTVSIKSGQLTRSGLQRMVASFHDEHRSKHGYALPQSPVDLVNYRVTALGQVAKLRLAPTVARKLTRPPRPKSSRRVHFQEVSSFVDCPIHALAELPIRSRVKGPAVIEHFGSTTLIPPKSIATVDEFRNLQIKV